MEKRTLLVGGGAVAGLVVVVAAMVWFVSPLLADPEPRPLPATAALRPTEPTRLRARPSKAPRDPERVAEMRAKMKHLRENKIRPEAMEGAVAARREERAAQREERDQDLQRRIDEVAASQGWDPALTEQIRGVILETQAHVRDTITQNRASQDGDRGAAREELAAYRADQRQQLLEIVGAEDYEQVVGDLGIERLFAGRQAAAGGRARPE